MHHFDEIQPRRERPEREPFPWDGRDSWGACNLAFGDIVYNFPGLLSDEQKRVHAPTMLAAIGACAGLAAQIGLLAGIASRLMEGGVEILHARDGRRMMFGAPLHHMIWPKDRLRWPHGVGTTMLEAAVNRGLRPEDYPEVDEFDKLVTSRMGTPEEGMPTCEAQPSISAKRLLELTWPAVIKWLRQIGRDKPGPLGPASVHFWPAITAQACKALYTKVPDGLLTPRDSLLIVAQSALWACHQDPALFDSSPPDEIKATLRAR